MKYELAKELEKAGFLQGGKGTWMYPTDAIVARSVSRVYVPTLEELIEACVALSQDGNFHLYAMSGMWGASTCWKHKKDERGNGSTPTEAVARLWLALNIQGERKS